MRRGTCESLLREPNLYRENDGLTRSRQTGESKAADYLKKQAAGEEVGQLVTLTADSYIDLRRDEG